MSSLLNGPLDGLDVPKAGD